MSTISAYFGKHSKKNDFCCEHSRKCNIIFGYISWCPARFQEYRVQLSGRALRTVPRSFLTPAHLCCSASKGFFCRLWRSPPFIFGLHQLRRKNSGILTAFGLFYFIIWNELCQIKRTEQHDLLILLWSFLSVTSRKSRIYVGTTQRLCWHVFLTDFTRIYAGFRL